MPHIDLHNDRPGIVGLFQYRPDTAGPLMELTELLLRGQSTLSRGERELIAMYVSALNECQYCTLTHATKATAQLPDGMLGALESDKLRGLLRIAAAVQRSGRAVTKELVDNARQVGATEREIHDTVLIAAAFCMYNRYVDGLDAVAPDDAETYLRMADFVMERGYTAALEPPEEDEDASQVAKVREEVFRLVTSNGANSALCELPGDDVQDVRDDAQDLQLLQQVQHATPVAVAAKPYRIPPRDRRMHVARQT